MSGRADQRIATLIEREQATQRELAEVKAAWEAYRAEVGQSLQSVTQQAQNDFLASLGIDSDCYDDIRARAQREGDAAKDFRSWVKGLDAAGKLHRYKAEPQRPQAANPGEEYLAALRQPAPIAATGGQPPPAYAPLPPAPSGAALADVLAKMTPQEYVAFKKARGGKIA